ncbi:hypothetical protein BDV25DRAFT_135783 [Aspergillus avenaceus]|uniref:Cupin type-1 domain-containing protein n=1 Tax=Aspergillus avenaceus TaxID=36643 RepID=A0A5N6U7I7_ASPAV|nr:hypothetical protein BDV25DRAFT_135783 [Aspergillus avenaceus]
MTPETLFVPPTAHSPNSTLPVLRYPNAITDKSLNGAVSTIQGPEWRKGGHWVIGREKLAATPHYHSITHEAYTVLKGTGTYLLGRSPLDAEVDASGNEIGVKFVAREGDVFVFPAGVMHYVTATEGEYEIVGFYNLNERSSEEEPYDMHYGLGSVKETEEMRVKCEMVATPLHDPVYGKGGPMCTLWR